MSVSLTTLPVELLDCIAEYGDRNGLLSLSQTHRRMNRVCLRWIYRAVALYDITRAIGCLKTFISNIQSAKSVRVLVFRFGRSDPPELLGAFYRLLRTALNNLQSVEYIDAATCPKIFTVMSTIHFTRLRECSIPFCADIVPFLHLHSKLEGLSLDPVPDTSVMWWTFLQPIQLSDLQMFSGPEVVAQAVVPDSRASHIIIFWDPRPQRDFGHFFETIAASGTTLLDVQNILITWDAPLLAAMAKCGASLTSFTVRNVSSVHQPLEIEDFLAGMDATLHSLRCLTALSIIEDALASSFDPADLDWEFATVRRWGDIAPALACCILPSETQWLRIRGSVWYPSNQSDDAAHLLARFRWFVTTVIASALPAEYLQVLESIGGRDMVRALQTAFERDGVLPEFVLAEKPDGISIAFSPA
ncbi:hypothetical protein B0H17DRAFT_1109606 [Mycena rosella]|uniref:F-box domain-containing protein n=1 Tax=Mycena rosella TaxID=1033263 RepID=A0AAD7BSN2_MYCRO|nr:hypothetical protein B0H17DRAFT_1109606 [Mycena rosella]